MIQNLTSHIYFGLLFYFFGASFLSDISEKDLAFFSVAFLFSFLIYIKKVYCSKIGKKVLPGIYIISLSLLFFFFSWNIFEYGFFFIFLLFLFGKEKERYFYAFFYFLVFSYCIQEKDFLFHIFFTLQIGIISVIFYFLDFSSKTISKSHFFQNSFFSFPYAGIIFLTYILFSLYIYEIFFLFPLFFALFLIAFLQSISSQYHFFTHKFSRKDFLFLCGLFPLFALPFLDRLPIAEKTSLLVFVLSSYLMYLIGIFSLNSLFYQKK